MHSRCGKSPAEDHGHKLGPTRKPSCMALRLVLLHLDREFHSRKQLQDLTENAAYSIQGGISDDLILVLPRNPTSTFADSAASRCRPKLIWTTVVWAPRLSVCFKRWKLWCACLSTYIGQ